MNWDSDTRIEVARRIAMALRDEAGSISPRIYEFSDALLFVLSMPDSFLNTNAEKFAEWTKK